MTSVNPPPQIILPKALSDMGIDVINYFQMQSRYDLQMFTRTGGATDEVATAIRTPVEIQAAIEDIRQRLGSGDALTSDSDSFTVDSTVLFVDQTEA